MRGHNGAFLTYMGLFFTLVFSAILSVQAEEVVRPLFQEDLIPCDGEKGTWTINADGSAGGFVADTAYVESFILGGEKKNIPYLGPLVQVCEQARVEGREVVLKGRSKVFGFAHVFEMAQIHEGAKIYGHAQVFGKAKVFGASQVFGYAKLFGVVKVVGMPRLGGWYEADRGIVFLDSCDSDEQGFNQIAPNSNQDDGQDDSQDDSQDDRKKDGEKTGREPIFLDR